LSSQHGHRYRTQKHRGCCVILVESIQKMRTSTLLLSLLVLTLFVAFVSCEGEEEKASTPATTSDFNFNTLMQGAWAVEISTIDQEITNEDELFSTKGVYNLTHHPLQEGILFGSFNQLGSADEVQSDAEYKLLAQTESEANTGSFKMIKRKKTEEEEESNIEEEVAELKSDDVVVFDIPFNFITHKSVVAGAQPVLYASSQGRFVAEHGRGTYEFLFTNRETFVLNLVYDVETPTEGKKFKIERIVGVKQVNREQSFFQKYGSTIMIAVFFMGSRLLTRQVAPQGAAAGGQ